MNKIKLVFFIAILTAFFIPEISHATPVGGGGFLGSGTSFLNALLGVMTNSWVRAIAVIAVIIAGVMAMAGRLSGGLAFWIVLGLVLVFGSAAIVDSIDSIV